MCRKPDSSNESKEINPVNESKKTVEQKINIWKLVVCLHINGELSEAEAERMHGNTQRVRSVREEAKCTENRSKQMRETEADAEAGAEHPRSVCVPVPAHLNRKRMLLLS